MHTGLRPAATCVTGHVESTRTRLVTQMNDPSTHAKRVMLTQQGLLDLDHTVVVVGCGVPVVHLDAASTVRAGLTAAEVTLPFRGSMW